MTRDFSQFLPGASLKPRAQDGAAHGLSPLQTLGWKPFFAQQLDADQLGQTPPVRVTSVHRSALRVLGEGIDTRVPPRFDATVGDWLLYDAERPADSIVLDRTSLLKRRAAGHERREQLIAANIDTAFIVTSCNNDFNIARLERYIALIADAGAEPVILLTKSDTCDDPSGYVDQARAISDSVPVLALDARGDAPLRHLAPWCKPGQTVAFLGSSGVGKSTLVNSLSGAQTMETAGIREDDARGRHTTTHRQLHILPAGFAVLDTPGMRELQLTDVAAGISEVFSDLQDIAHQCKFNDCRHQGEPGCAVQAALDTGAIDAKRVDRWMKLVAEEAHNTATLAQRKSKDKALGKTIKAMQKKNRK